MFNLVNTAIGGSELPSDALRLLDKNFDATNDVILLYNGSNAPTSTFGVTTGWNREHQWPNSYGSTMFNPPTAIFTTFAPATRQ